MTTLRNSGILLAIFLLGAASGQADSRYHRHSRGDLGEAAFELARSAERLHDRAEHVFHSRDWREARALEALRRLDAAARSLHHSLASTRHGSYGRGSRGYGPTDYGRAIEPSSAMREVRRAWQNACADLEGLRGARALGGHVGRFEADLQAVEWAWDGGSRAYGRYDERYDGRRSSDRRRIEIRLPPLPLPPLPPFLR